MNDLTHGNSEETFLSRLWRRVRGVSEPNLRESIEDALDETEEEGAEFSLEERHMLRNLLGFRDVRVDDVMVPRADISAIDLATSGEDVLAVFVESGHSRLPVYRETLDSPVGMLHLKDVIAARRKPAKFVVQLYKMICEDPDLVRWHSGNIIMPNPTALKLKARGRARARARAPRSDARRRNRAPCTSVRSQQHTPARRLSRLRSSRTTSSTRTSRPVSYTHLTLPTN